MAPSRNTRILSEKDLSLTLDKFWQETVERLTPNIPSDRYVLARRVFEVFYRYSFADFALQTLGLEAKGKGADYALMQSAFLGTLDKLQAAFGEPNGTRTTSDRLDTRLE